MTLFRRSLDKVAFDAGIQFYIISIKLARNICIVKQISNISLMNNRNNVEPRTLPCGTPLTTCAACERQLCSLTVWDLLCRNNYEVPRRLFLQVNLTNFAFEYECNDAVTSRNKVELNETALINSLLMRQLRSNRSPNIKRVWERQHCQKSSAKSLNGSLTDAWRRIVVKLNATVRKHSARRHLVGRSLCIKPAP